MFYQRLKHLGGLSPVLGLIGPSSGPSSGLVSGSEHQKHVVEELAVLKGYPWIISGGINNVGSNKVRRERVDKEVRDGWSVPCGCGNVDQQVERSLNERSSANRCFSERYVKHEPCSIWQARRRQQGPSYLQTSSKIYQNGSKYCVNPILRCQTQEGH